MAQLHPFGSLAALEEQFLQRFKRRPLMPIDRDWFQLAHRTDPSGGGFATVREHLMRLREGRLGAACTDIFAHAAAGVVGGKATDFMGPMCCPMTKTNLSYVTGDDGARGYTVTEKSDGVRVILVSLFSPAFPRWLVPRQRGAPPLPLPLMDVAILEEARDALLQNNAVQSPRLLLTIGAFALRIEDDNAGATQRLILRSVAGAAPSTADAAPTATEDGSACLSYNDLTVGRATGRYFTYLFDRSMSGPHLVIEEYAFPGLAAVVLDGELLWSIASAANGPSRLVFGVFDLLSYTPMPALAAAVASYNEAVENGKSSHGAYGMPSAHDIPAENVSRCTMPQRYELIDRLATGPHAAYYKSAALPPPETFVVFRKRMYTLEELGDLVGLLAPAPGGGSSSGLYTYAGRSYNDGLVFTPRCFDLVTGAREDQLKWKWPDRLTVDWFLTPQPSSRGEYFKMELFFRKKKIREQDVAGRTTMGTYQLQNPKQLKVPPEGCVAECSWDGEKGAWRIEDVRGDKGEPNSVVTALSVVQSACERLDLDALAANFPFGAGRRTHLRGMGRPAPEAVEVRPVHMILRAMYESNADACAADGAGAGADAPTHASGDAAPVVLRLQWQVQMPGLKNPVVANHVDVRQCFGLGEPCPATHPTVSRLVGRLAIHLANDGGCYAWSDTSCLCQFDPPTGRWGIVSVGRNKDQAYATTVMRHLQEVASVVLRGAVVAPRKELHVVPSIASADSEPEGPRPLRRPAAANDGSKLPPPASSATPTAGNNTSDGAAGIAADNNAEEEGEFVAGTATHHQTAVFAGPMTSVPSDQHYAERTRALKCQRRAERSVLRLHNNWVKALLLADAAALSIAATRNGHGKAAVLDLCCGRGGDLMKWRNLPVRFLMMVDSCFEAVAAAAERYSVTKGLSTCIVSNAHNRLPPGIPASFHELDCFSCLLRSTVELQKATRTHLSEGFDIVSCQFSIHYAFSSDERVRELLANVSTSLRPGGVFVGTTVDDEALRMGRERHGGGETFGNSCFAVSFLAADDPAGKTSRGAAYRFSIEESVVDAVEYVVDWSWFVALAASADFGLDLVRSENFAAFRVARGATVEGQRQWSEMQPGSAGSKRGVDGATREVAIGEALSAAEAEATSLFRTFIFQKRAAA